MRSVVSAAWAAAWRKAREQLVECERRSSPRAWRRRAWRWRVETIGGRSEPTRPASARRECIYPLTLSALHVLLFHPYGIAQTVFKSATLGRQVDHLQQRERVALDQAVLPLSLRPSATHDGRAHEVARLCHLDELRAARNKATSSMLQVGSYTSHVHIDPRSPDQKCEKRKGVETWSI